MLIVVQLMTTDRPPTQSQEVGDLTRRVADLEGALGTRPGAGLRARVEEMGRSIGALGETQAKLARETKALDAKVGSRAGVSPELMGRLAKLEEALGAATAADPAAQSPQVAALSGKLAELEKAARNATELARSGIARFDGELVGAADRRGPSGPAARHPEGRDRGAAQGSRQGRRSGAARPPRLRRWSATCRHSSRARPTAPPAPTPMPRRCCSPSSLPTSSAPSIAARATPRSWRRAKKLGGFTLNFTALERYMKEGAAAPQELAKSFRKVADAMLDAEAETPNSTLMDRLLSGARSIVRVRKAGHAADDASLEAIIGRMEAAMKDGRLADVLANAKKLPPKAALAGEDWVKKVEARQAVEQAMAEVEAQLKASLGGPSPQSAPKSAAPEGKR